MLNHSVKTVLLHALSMTFFLTNARSVIIPSMEMGVTRNALTTVNHVIYEMAHAMNVNKTVQVYCLFGIKVLNNDFLWQICMFLI